MEENRFYQELYSGPNGSWWKKVKPNNIFNLAVFRQTVTAGTNLVKVSTSTIFTRITSLLVSGETDAVAHIVVDGSTVASYAHRGDTSATLIQGDQFSPLKTVNASSTITLVLQAQTTGIMAAQLYGVQEPTFAQREVN